MQLLKNLANEDRKSVYKATLVVLPFSLPMWYGILVLVGLL